MPRSMRLRAALLAITGTLAIAAQADDVAKPIEVPAGDLLVAMESLQKQSDVQVLFQDSLLKGVKTPGVSGTLTVQDAVKKLLQGTRLTLSTDAATGAMLITTASAGAKPIAITDRSTAPLRLAQVSSAQDTTGSSAQDGGAGTQSAAADPNEPDEIVVKGQKLQEGSIGGWLPVPLHELPRTVQVIDEEMISKQFVSHIKDILKNVPGLQIVPDNNLAGYQTPTIRGVPASSYFEGHNAGVVTGIPEAIGRAEVLQGFNSLQFGVDGGGGSVNFFLKRPTAVSFLDAQVQTTNWGGGKIVLDGNMHTDTGGETDGLRFIGVFDRTESYVRDYPQRRGEAGSVMWRYSGFEGFQIDADVSFWKILNDPSGQYIDFVNPPNVDELPDFNPRNNLTQPWSENSMRKGNQFDLRITRELGPNWKATIEGSLDRLTYRDDGCRITGPNFATGEASYVCFQSGFGPLWDRHFRMDLSGQFSLAGTDHFLAVGYRRTGQSYKQVTDRVSFPDAPYNMQNIYNPRIYPKPASGVFSPANNFRSTGTNGLLYLQDRIAFSPKWDLWAGVGYVDNKGHYGGPTFPVYYPPQTHAVLPTGGLVFKPTSDQTYYLSYSEGISYAEPVGLNDPTIINGGELLPAIHFKNYELGGKWIVNSRLQLNAAAFRMQQPFNITEQVSAIPPRFRRYAGGLNEFTGISVDFYGKLLRNLSVQGGFAYVDPVQEDTPDPALKGKNSAGVSRRSATLNVNWDVGAPSGLELDGGIYHQGSMPLNVINTYTLEGFTRFDVGGSYTTSWNDHELRYRLLVENALDDRFYYGFIYGFQVAAPRTFNASVSVRF